jgi:hypothetical protein
MGILSRAAKGVDAIREKLPSGRNVATGLADELVYTRDRVGRVAAAARAVVEPVVGKVDRFNVFYPLNYTDIIINQLDGTAEDVKLMKSVFPAMINGEVAAGKSLKHLIDEQSYTLWLAGMDIDLFKRFLKHPDVLSRIVHNTIDPVDNPSSFIQWWSIHIDATADRIAALGKQRIEQGSEEDQYLQSKWDAYRGGYKPGSNSATINQLIQFYQTGKNTDGPNLRSFDVKGWFLNKAQDVEAMVAPKIDETVDNAWIDRCTNIAPGLTKEAARTEFFNKLGRDAISKYGSVIELNLNVTKKAYQDYVKPVASKDEVETEQSLMFLVKDGCEEEILRLAGGEDASVSFRVLPSGGNYYKGSVNDILEGVDENMPGLEEIIDRSLPDNFNLGGKPQVARGERVLCPSHIRVQFEQMKGDDGEFSEDVARHYVYCLFRNVDTTKGRTELPTRTHERVDELVKLVTDEYFAEIAKPLNDLLVGALGDESNNYATLIKTAADRKAAKPLRWAARVKTEFVRLIDHVEHEECESDRKYEADLFYNFLEAYGINVKRGQFDAKMNFAKIFYVKDNEIIPADKFEGDPQDWEKVELTYMEAQCNDLSFKVFYDDKKLHTAMNYKLALSMARKHFRYGIRRKKDKVKDGCRFHLIFDNENDLRQFYQNIVKKWGTEALIEEIDDVGYNFDDSTGNDFNPDSAPDFRQINVILAARTVLHRGETRLKDRVKTTLAEMKLNELDIAVGGISKTHSTSHEHYKGRGANAEAQALMPRRYFPELYEEVGGQTRQEWKYIGYDQAA